MGQQNSCKTSIGTHSTMHLMHTNVIKFLQLLLVKCIHRGGGEQCDLLGGRGIGGIQILERGQCMGGGASAN